MKKRGESMQSQANERAGRDRSHRRAEERKKKKLAVAKAKELQRVRGERYDIAIKRVHALLALLALLVSLLTKVFVSYQSFLL